MPLAKGKYSNKLKFGAKVVDKNKDMWIDFYEYSPTDEDAFIADAFGTKTATDTWAATAIR